MAKKIFPTSKKTSFQKVSKAIPIKDKIYFKKIQNNALKRKLLSYLENKSIGEKISSSFKIIIILMLAAMIFSITSVVSIASRTNKLYTSPYNILSTISNIKINDKLLVYKLRSSEYR